MNVLFHGEKKMPGPTSAHMLVSAMIKGGEKAVKDFSAISGDEWFGEAPEYVLTTYACGGLRNIENSSALFEVSVGEMRSAAGAIRRGRPAEHERLNGRIDFVIYWANQLPRAAIEVKSPIWSADKARLVPDFVELCRALLACSSSSLQFCGFVFYASVDEPERKHKNTKQRLRGLLDRVMELAKGVADECGSISVDLESGKIRNHSCGAWCVSCVVFTHVGREIRH